VPPTIVDSLGLNVPDVWDGRSLCPRIGKEAAPREHAFIDVGAELNFQHAGLRRCDGWKLLRHDGTEYLFDLTENPSESPQDDRKESDPGVYQELTTALDDHLEEMQRRREMGPGGVEDEQIIEDHLKELGYLE
jgi:arylsulfatase A-like enzyme